MMCLIYILYFENSQLILLQILELHMNGKRSPINTAKRPLLYQQIQNELLKRIQQGIWRPGDRIPSVREICVEFDVSHITANRVLKDMTALGIIERQRGRGSFLRSNRPSVARVSSTGVRTRRLGLVAPRRSSGNLFFDGYYSAIGKSIVDRAHEAGIEVRMAYLPGHSLTQKSSIREWMGTGVDGIIYLSVSGFCLEAASLALQLGIPALFLDSYEEGWPCVVMDHGAAAALVCRKLLEAGHRRIGYVGHQAQPANESNEADRAAIIPTIAHEVGLDLGNRLLPQFPSHTPDLETPLRWVREQGVTAIAFSVHAQYTQMYEFLRLHHPDMLPALSFVALDRHALRKDVVVPTLSGTEADRIAMGQVAFDWLHDLIQRGVSPRSEGAKRLIGISWHEGETLRRLA
jgi:DNA-binding LacI/PurR family transcriptional regulator